MSKRTPFNPGLTPKDVAKQCMQLLSIPTPYILDFENNGYVYLHDNGDVRIIDPDSILGRKIETIEKQSRVKVYAVVHSVIDLVGNNFAFLCISPYPEDWEHSFNRYGNTFTAYSYVWNTTCEECSEFGSVALTATFGALRRVG